MSKTGTNAPDRFLSHLESLFSVTLQDAREIMLHFHEEMQRGGPPGQFIGILQDGTHPFYRFNDFRHTDASITVAVDHFKGFTVEFETDCRAAQDNPEFLVQLIQGHQVGAAIQTHLIKTAGPEKGPAMHGIPGLRGTIRCYGLYIPFVYVNRNRTSFDELYQFSDFLRVHQL